MPEQRSCLAPSTGKSLKRLSHTSGASKCLNLDGISTRCQNLSAIKSISHCVLQIAYFNPSISENCTEGQQYRSKKDVIRWKRTQANQIPFIES